MSAPDSSSRRSTITSSGRWSIPPGRTGRTTTPAFDSGWPAAYTSSQLMRYSHMRLLENLAAGRPLGPESSLGKLIWSENLKQNGELLMDICGPAATVRPGPAGPDYEVDFWQDLFLVSRAASIYAGTNEIQRNIVAERVPRPAAPTEGWLRAGTDGGAGRPAWSRATRHQSPIQARTPSFTPCGRFPGRSRACTGAGCPVAGAA